MKLHIILFAKEKSNIEYDGAIQYNLLIYFTGCSHSGNIYTPLSIRYIQIVGKCKWIKQYGDI